MNTNKKIYMPTQFLCISIAILCFALAVFTGLTTYKQQEIFQQNTIIATQPNPNIFNDSNAVMMSFKTYEPLMQFNKFSILEFIPTELVKKEYLNSGEDPKILSDEVTESTPSTSEESSTTGLASESVITTIYTIKSGDSYWKIAGKYYGWGGYCYALCKYNGITTDTILHPGDTIIIPSAYDPTFSKMIMGLTGEQLTNETIGYTYDDAYYHGTRTRAAVDINIPTGDNMKNFTGEVDTSSYRYLGNYHLTGYAFNCAHCNGGDTSGIGASGVTMIPGYSIAMSKDIPFGTTVYIEGYGYYVVEDRGGGIGPGRIDIACPDHDSCYTTVDRMYDVPVYIVD